MKKGLDKCDIVMMLRLQNERMQGSFLPSAREYYEYFGLTPDKLKLAKRCFNNASWPNEQRC